MKKEVIGELFGQFEQACYNYSGVEFWSARELQSTLTIKAKDFANALTSHNVIEKDLNNQTSISKEHIDNNKAVKNILLKRGVRPEALPAAEDVKKLEKRLDNDEKEVTKTVNRSKK